MKKYEKLVNFCQYSTIIYHSIHRSYADVIQHLFFVIGNGYDYEDGDIFTTVNRKRKSIFNIPAITPNRISELCKQIEEANEIAASRHRNPEFSRRYDGEIMDSLKDKIKSGFFDINDNVFSYGSFLNDFKNSRHQPVELYPLCESAKIYKFIKSSDLELLIIAHNFIEAYLYYITEYMEVNPETKLRDELTGYVNLNNELTDIIGKST